MEENCYSACLLPDHIIQSIKAWSALRKYHKICHNVATLIGYAYSAPYFQKNDVKKLLHCSDHTAQVYLGRLNELKVLKRLYHSNIKNISKGRVGYELKKYPYINILYMFLLTNLICPRMIRKESAIQKIIKEQHNAIKQELCIQ